MNAGKNVQGITRGVLIVIAAWAALVAASIGIEHWTGKPVPTCLFKRLTGHPCPTCGSTRAVIALGRGDVPGAIAWNPMVMALLVLGPVVVVWKMMAARRRARLGLPPTYWSPTQRAIAWVVGIAIVAGNWGYVIWRGN